MEGVGSALVVVDDQDALRAIVADGTLAYTCLEVGSSFVSRACVWESVGFMDYIVVRIHASY